MDKQPNKAQPDAPTYLRAVIRFADWIGQPYKDLVDENDSTDFVRELYLCACMGIDPEKIEEAKAQPNPPHSMAALRRIALESEILTGPELKLSQLTERIDGTEDSLEDIRLAIDKIAAVLQSAEERAPVIRKEQSTVDSELPVEEETTSQEDNITEQVTKAALGAVAAAPAADGNPESSGTKIQDSTQEKPRDSARRDNPPKDNKEDTQGADVPEDRDPSQTKQPEPENSGSAASETAVGSESVSEELAAVFAKPQKKSWMERRKIHKEQKKMLSFLNQVMEGGYDSEQIEFLLSQLEAGDTPDEAALYASKNLPVEVMERLRGIYNTKGDKNHG